MTEYRALRIAREMAARNEGRYFKDWIKRQSQKAGQSMTPLTDRERELVEAVKEIFSYSPGGMWSPGFAVPTEKVYRMFMALRAYDPPKRKTYTLPAWEHLSEKRQDAFKACFRPVWAGVECDIWAAIREALSTEEE